MRLWKMVLNLLFLGILVLTGMELSNLFLSYVDKVFAEEDIKAEIKLDTSKERDKKKEDLGKYLEGKRTLARNILDITPQEKKEATQVKKEEAKKEEVRTLNVRLLGIVTGATEEAVISDGSGIKRIKVGDDVMGYKVKKIERDLVILQKDNGEEALISFQYSGAQVSQEIKKPSQPTASATSPEPPKEEKKAEADVTKTAEGKTVISRDTVNEFLMSPQNFLKGIFIGPNFKDNKPNGFIVRNITNEHILAKIGIKRGDIIKKVNGIEINNVTDYYNAIRSVTQGENLTITIEREGKEIDIGCEIR
ncbi:MAG: PDZ domain-containing protein [Synergistetes bacterium]|nr:PDZ domain-containing protein [Synergistota bacterium]MDW8191606.1 PDZ domain-containing protein [Synergistota bacterium]